MLGPFRRAVIGKELVQDLDDRRALFGRPEPVEVHAFLDGLMRRFDLAGDVEQGVACEIEQSANDACWSKSTTIDGHVLDALDALDMAQASHALRLLRIHHKQLPRTLVKQLFALA